ESLTEHAERLMVKYGIEQARLDARRAETGQAREEIVQERMLFAGAYARDIRELGAGIGIALGTIRPMYSEAATGRSCISWDSPPMCSRRSCSPRASKCRR